MLRPAPGGVIPGRPHRPLVVRCGYDGSTRPVNFPSAASCRLESLRTRVEECFALSAWPFVLTYTDDDGEEYHVRSEADLTDAIAYFASGDDEGGNSAGAAGRPPAAPKISMRVDVVVEYDGPSLSDTSSIASFRTSERSWHSSERSAAQSDSRSSFEYRSSRASRYSAVPPITTDLADGIGAMRLSSPGSTLSGGPSSGPSTVLLGRARASPSELDAASAASYSRHRGRSENAYYDDSAPALMGHSELGSRWLREQSQLANRMPRLRLGARGSTRRFDSDDEGLNSDDESLGDIELVQDARGRYYYSYQTETSSLSSQSEADFDSMEHAGPSSAGFTSPRLLGGRRTSPDASEVEEVTRAPSSEPAGPPVLAPDCSACGVRLDYMRYVCVQCGEGELWTVNAVGKAPFEPPRLPSAQSDGDATESSEGTAWGPLASSTGSQTVYRGGDGRSRSGSISTNASVHSLAVANGSAVSPGSPRSIQFDLDGNPTPARHRATPRGYELCPTCIEVHGIAHSKAANRGERDANGQRKKRSGQLRHTFREKIWGAEGWMDIEYAEDSECTICNTPLVNNRYKCVSCSKFDLCRSCYQKVDEIHPVHVFLSLPDKPLPSLEVVSTSTALGNGHTETQPIRHPGAFCHNCLQDIVGPRFHCAVCPSWDLCIQCEGLTTSGDGQHTADHIMMKIPIPLATSEVEAVSRRARDRWFQQDSSTVARRTPGGSTASRSSSPSQDTETVYAPTRRSVRSAIAPAPRLPALCNSGRATPSTTRQQQVAARPRDDLDHNARCANCNEWIMGRRYQCANCPSDPEPYNLCSICELRSYRVHDPRHVFFKFDRPVHIPLQSTQPLLPLLYKNRAGQVPATAVLSPHDPTAYLKHVLHRETLCDIHSDQIRGMWFRCAHCPGGFDVCQEAERTANHDPTHVFVVFKARVDMVAFRELANLAATYPKPLLKQQVYFS